MPNNTSISVTGRSKNSAARFTAADPVLDASFNNSKVLAEATDTDLLIRAVSICSTAAANRDFSLFIESGADKRLIGTVAVLSNAGFTSAVQAVGVLDAVYLKVVTNDPYSNPSLLLQKGERLVGGIKATALTGAEVIDVKVIAEDFGVAS